VTERIDTVTWEGGEIKADEFQEFGMSFAVPEDAGTYQFPTVQTYSNGDVVRWIGPEDSDEPAPALTVEEGGDTTTSSPPSTGSGSSGGSTGAEEPATEPTVTTAEAASAESGDDSDGRATLALVVGIAGLLAGLAALAWVLFTPRKRP
jgi:hypothetical protein